MSGYRFDRLKVLVVDDNVHMRRLVATILRAFGVHDIYEAENGERGWELLRANNPDVVVLDWVLDGMSGLDLARMIRTDTHAPNPFVPIIMLTGHADASHVVLARDAGVNEFIAKPVAPTAMMMRLVAVIEHPRAYVRTGAYFGPCRRRRTHDEYPGPERRAEATPQAAE